MLMKKSSVRYKSLLLSSFLLLLVPALSGQEVKIKWEINPQEQLGGEIYQSAVLIEKGMAVCLTRHQIAGIDFSGKISTPIELMPGQRANLSCGGGYIGVMRIKAAFIDFYELKTPDNIPVATIKPVGNYISFVASRNAQMIIGISLEGGRELWNSIRTYHFFDTQGTEKGNVEAGSPTFLSFSPDGEVFVINDKKQGLASYLPDGNRAWGVDESYRFFQASNGARRLIGNSSSQIEKAVLFEDGSPIADVSLPSPVHHVAISPKGESIVATTARTVKFYTGALQEVWSHTFDDESLAINSISVADNGLFACGLIKDNGPRNPIESRYTEGHVFLFNRNGGEVWNRNYSFKLANAWIPIVDIAPVADDQSILTVRTREKMYLYTITL